MKTDNITSMKKVIRTLLLSMAFMAIPSVSLVSCSNNDEPEIEPKLAEEYSGTYNGTITLNVADQYSYDADISCVITAGDNETITVSFPEYSLSGTMMGDMTLGSVTISNLVYDENKGGFYRNYGGEGITQTMNDKAYPLNAPSSIIVTKDKNGNLAIENPFTLGKMPLPLTATFEGQK